MTIIKDFMDGVDDALEFGQKIRIKYYNVNYTGDYDDDVTLTQSGTDFWTSGLLMPIWSRSRYSAQSNEAVLVEEGKVLLSDAKLFVRGDINLSGTIKIGIGSGIGSPFGEFSVLDTGIMNWIVNQTPVMKTIYVRRLTNGSLAGE